MRLTLDLSPAMIEKLDKLVVSMDAASKSEVLRKGIALMKIAMDAKARGERLVLSNHDDVITAVIVGYY